MSDPTPLPGEIEKESATQNRNLVIIEKITNGLLQMASPFLVQFWAPVTTGGRCFLATSDQPFGISRYHEGLCAYRKLCMDYRFYVDMDTTDEKEFGGLIRSAFVQISPTWHQDLQYCCSNKEYPQLDHLVQCKIKGIVTFPMLEPSSMCCVGVIEVLSTTAEDIHSDLYFLIFFIRGLLKEVDLILYPSSSDSDQESEEELSVEVINSSTEKNFDTNQIEIDIATKSPPGTEDLLNGGGMVQPLQLAVEDDTINNGSDVINAGKSCLSTATDLVKEGKIKTTKSEHRKNETSISYEALKGCFGMKLEDAAEKLGASRSTLKRLCRQYGVPRWPSHKRNKVNHPPSSNQDPSSSNPPIDQAIQDGRRIATIKAAYKDDIIMFQLSFSSRMIDLEEEVRKRLKLEIGTFKIKYEDGDGDRILIACDEDLKNCISILTSLGKTTIKMFVELGTFS